MGVPNIPKDIKVSKCRRKRMICIEWIPNESSYLDEGGGGGGGGGEAGTVLYLVEERHHAGRLFIESMMSEWTACARTLKRSQILKHLAKPGRWYQFRVAAVNENGTKGYSEQSLPFTVSTTPKPPKAPQNMTVGPLIIRNGSITAELKWTPPVLDLPLQRYKVFWSRRLHGIKELDSVLVHQQVIPRDQTHFLLQKLQPNSQYFLQVQALVQFGKERLKGEKSGLVLNTTNYTNVSDNALILEGVTDNRIDGLHLQKLMWSQNNLRARIVWKPKRDLTKYTVTWWNGPCHATKGDYSHLKLAATTNVPYFNLYDLQFSCRYRVSVREVSSQGMKTIRDTSITFTTPKCSSFRASHKKIRCH
ncbi:hypothetical protein NQ315_015417 [Exocentrus adspersus]|uniref:Fibronectin type-III domain-containing protein n=1 Tax=Exocentrus adspersus TaxID=1586481 RepID=A0AAV8VMF1_9CUCU|nr:hypothetical protein NQ315_015417 [Exocentrus adspersus]